MTATSAGATPAASSRSTSAAHSSASPGFSFESEPGGVSSSNPRPAVSHTSSGRPSMEWSATAGWARSAPP
jgi:hypothetical protein